LHEISTETWKTLWKNILVYCNVTHQFECFSDLHHSRAKERSVVMHAFDRSA